MKTKLISVFILFVLYALSFTTVAFAQDPIVYSRCERTQPFDLEANVTINGEVQTVTRRMTGVDIYDVLPDVTNFFGNFSAPCDLVYRDSNGDETIIYNCSSNPAYPGDPGDPGNNGSCAALDAAVSFDGNTIAFSVFKGKLSYYKGQNIHTQVVHPDAEPGTLGFRELPNKLLNTDGAHLHLYTVSTGQIREISPFEEGIYDTGPAFISSERIAFTSTRDDHTTTLVWGTNVSDKGTRIWTVDIDGKNLDLASHHSLSQEQHPFMLRDGRLAYSSWQIFGGLPFRHSNHGPGGHTTIDNLFHIYAQDPDGAGNFPIYGQHSGDHYKSYFGAVHNAAHFLTQTSDGRVWFADYYRSNNKGLGVLVGVIPEAEGREGLHPNLATHQGDFYVPEDVINFASWTNNNDDFAEPMVSLGQSVTHPNYTDPLPFTGKLGHPAALTDNDLMVAWGKGACSTVTNNKIFTALGMPTPPMTDGSSHGTSMNVITSLEMDTPGCDVGLYRATQIPSQNPNDLVMIVDSKEWHEIMARAVVPYSAIHDGYPAPLEIENAHLRTTHTELQPGTPFGLFGAASITDRETKPADGIHFAGLQQFNLQGTDTIDYTDDDLCGIRILGVMPNRNTQVVDEIANYAGERVAILGEFSVLNYGTDGNRIIDDSGHPDTSFLVRMPANTPYLTQGIDCDGRTLNTDQTWQSVRPGEQKTCNGCHVHSKPARTEFDTTFAASSEYTIPRLGEGAVPLLNGKSGDTVETRTVPGYGMRIEFTQDIKPIFDQHCISCHSGSNAAAGLELDQTNNPNNTNTYNNTSGETWWCLVADKGQACVEPANQTGTTFGRPQMTRYIRAFNSRGSLLYWKAANQRTDNRTDAQYSDDIDFGANHPTTITAEELGILSRWIDIGAPGGGATELYDTQKPTLHLAAGDGELHVGTVDLGSGIDTGTLLVCVLDSNGNCGNNLAGVAQQHGITTVSLSLGDPDTEIYAQVKDLAGNMTEVYRTVGWLQANASGSTNTGDSQAPNITITSPDNSSEVSGAISVAVSYSDNVGVTAVELYVNGQYQSRNTQEPFTFTLDTTTLDNTEHTLTARAFDAADNQKTSLPVTVIVNNEGGSGQDTEAPVVSITSPAGGTVSNTILVEVDATDNIGVTAVELVVNGQSMGTSNQAPYTFTLDTTTVADGNYALTAQALDAAGNEGTSSPVNVTVQNDTGGSDDTEPPTIFMTVSGPYTGTVPVIFDVSDNVGVARVEMRIAEGHDQVDYPILVGTITGSPFELNWDTKQFANGNYSIAAYAFDAAGNPKRSNSKNITVDNPADTEAPVVSIASPTGGTVSDTISVDVTATDNVGVTAVELFANGQSMGTSNQAPYTFTLDTTTVADGNYALTAQALDAAGNEGTSSPVNVTVQNDTGGSDDTEPPTIFMTVSGPYTGTVPVIFDVSDNVGVARVEMRIAEGHDQVDYPILVGTITGSPFELNWDTTQFANGNYSIAAYAFDAAGNPKRSNSKNITVDNSADTEAPTIFMTVSGPYVGTVPVTFDVSDNVGVARVEMRIAEGHDQVDFPDLVGTITGSPFELNWDTTQFANGNYSIAAYAFDVAGNPKRSNSKNITVDN